MTAHHVVQWLASHASPINWGSVPDWIVAIAAAATAAFGSYQLYLLRVSRQDSVRAQEADFVRSQQDLKTAQGTQLMQIDQQYEGVLQPSRKALLALRRRVSADIPDNIPDRRNEIARRVSAYLDNLRLRAAPRYLPLAGNVSRRYEDEYFLLTQLPNYIETMGLLVAEGLVDERLLIGLYDVMIERVMGDVIPHYHRRRQRDQTPTLLLYAEQLYVKAVNHMMRPTAP